MSISSIPDERLLEYLDTAQKLFSKMDLKSSAILVREMKHIIETTKPKIDKNKLNKKFIDLQDTIDVEFSKKGTHHEKIIKQLQHALRTTLTKNLSNYQRVFQDNTKMEKVQQRSDSYRNTELLKSMVIKSATTDEERLIGISYAYLGLVNGIYRLSLHDCYALQKLSQDESVDPEAVKNMEVADIKDYFTTKGLPMDYFDGLDTIVRNAVGHSNFHYDSTKERMTYIDEPNNPTKKRIMEYSFAEMVENYEKLESLYSAILIINQLINVSSTCKELSDRYPP